MKRGRSDPYGLTRFVGAQEGVFEQALAEIRAGRKRSHWMWYVFPQFKGLGSSPTSIQYAIGSAAEALAYLAHPILGPRLLECAEAALQIDNRSALEIFGSPDDMKICARLMPGKLLPCRYGCQACNDNVTRECELLPGRGIGTIY